MNNKTRDIARLSAVLIYLLFICVLEIMSGNSDMPGNLDDPSVIHLMQGFQFIAAIITFVLPAVLIAVFLAPDRLGYLGVNTFPKPYYYLLAFVLIIFALPLIGGMDAINKQMSLPSSLSGLETWMKNSEDKAAKLTGALLKMDTPLALVINLIVIAFMAALSEELFFRGLVQNVLKDRIRNYHVAVWLSAIIFSAFHMQFYGFLPRMVLGAVLGYLYIWSGSIWVPVLAHFTNNAIGVISVYLQQHGKISNQLDAVGTTKEDLVYILVSLLVCSALLFLAWRMRKREDSVVVPVD